MTRTLPDLIELAAGPMLTPEQRRKLKPPCGKGARGHVAPPGTGPDGETCGSCQHLARKRLAKTYLKCGHPRAVWTGGGKTDVRARDHACREWKAKERQTNPVPEGAGPFSGTSPNGGTPSAVSQAASLAADGDSITRKPRS